MRDQIQNLPRFRDKVVVTLDLLLGLRAWGLILYGVLPANLALLGMLEIKLGTIAHLIPFILPVIALPLITTFLLIRNRHKEWYLTTDLLGFRSIVVTTVILLIATLISGMSGIIHGKYIVSWAYFNTKEHWTTIAESFVLAVGSLVLTSTLFLTILTKDSNFPGLPSVDFVNLLKEIRIQLRMLKASPVWGKALADQETFDNAKLLDENLTKLTAYTGHVLPKLSLSPVHAGVKSFIKAAKRLESGFFNETSRQLSWNQYFASSVKPSTQDAKRNVVQAPPPAPDDASLIKLLKAMKLGN
jgi:hypothetical protein